MEILSTDVLSLDNKMENIEAKAKTATVGVLKEVFGFGDVFVPHVEGVTGVAIQDLELGAGSVEEMVMPSDEALGEIKPSSSGYQFSFPSYIYVLSINRVWQSLLEGL